MICTPKVGLNNQQIKVQIFMTKYNQSFKQQVIEFYLQNGKNQSLTCQHFQLADSTLRRWINQYNHNGINGLAVLGKKRIYSPEFKLSVIQAVKNGQFSAESACLYFGIANSGIISQYSDISLSAAYLFTSQGDLSFRLFGSSPLPYRTG
ncbi:Transposase [Glaesserella parasuis]|nr:Transposase [Glaesserella parasuis]